MIRIAGPADAPAVSALLCEFNGEGLAPEDLARRMADVQALETAFLAEWGSQPAGILVLRIVPTLSGAGEWAEVTEVYVRPVFRRRGLGRALMEAALDHARGAGCHEIQLLVNPTNTAAQAFYTALGFRPRSLEMHRLL